MLEALAAYAGVLLFLIAPLALVVWLLYKVDRPLEEGAELERFEQYSVSAGSRRSSWWSSL
ncbi:MAG: hypothetical protein QW405_03270 [Fervidicoccaceae archaeon]